MLASYFTDPGTLARYRSGLAGSHLDDFIAWLEYRGYRRRSIRLHTREVVRFSAWAKGLGLTVHDLNGEALDRLRRDLAGRNALRYPCGNPTHLYQSACVFVRFLEAIGAVKRCASPVSDDPPALFLAFRAWMRAQRGTLDSSINNYRLPIIDLLRSLGQEPERYTARGLRDFVMQRAGADHPEKGKNVVTAVRMFLRFLIASGRCAAQLEHAIPTVAKWRLSSLPKYLAADDVERLISSCDPSAPLGARDRAMLLLLARLGLRARDVSALKLDNLLWSEGTLVVSGKNRRETRLPLPQDVGDAILHYLECARPRLASDAVFMTTVAPLVPISRQGVGRAVRRALRRTGIAAPTQGAHLLRHSMATRMLREDVSLSAIGALLRHASIETTTVYAKVDIELLQEVALPWPQEVPPC